MSGGKYQFGHDLAVYADEAIAWLADRIEESRIGDSDVDADRRNAFCDHLRRVAIAVKAIDRHDCGDGGPEDEEAAIAAVLSVNEKGAVFESAVRRLEVVANRLHEVAARHSEPRPVAPPELPAPEAAGRAYRLRDDACKAGLYDGEIVTESAGGVALRFFDADCTRGRYAWISCMNSGADICWLVGSRGGTATSIPLSPPPWARIKEYLGR